MAQNVRDPFPPRSSPESTVMRFCHEVILYRKFISLRVHVHGNDHEKKNADEKKKKGKYIFNSLQIHFFLFVSFLFSLLL